MANASIATKEHRILSIERQNLRRNRQVRKRRLATIPIIRNPLGDMIPAALAITDGTKKTRNRRQIGLARRTERREEFVKEGSGAIEEQGFGTEVEVAVCSEGIVVALRAVEREVVAVEVAFAGGLHGGEEGAVEGVVVEGGAEKVVGAGEGGVGFEFLVIWGEPDSFEKKGDRVGKMEIEYGKLDGSDLRCVRSGLVRHQAGNR